LARFVLIHGAASDSRDWNLVKHILEARGHQVMAPDLPCDDDSAGLSEYRDSVIAAIPERMGVVVVAHSFGGFTAPLVCDRVAADLLVFVNGIIPAPGESPGEWWANTGWNGPSAAGTEEETIEVFLHDVPPELARDALARAKAQSGTPFGKGWPLTTWPEVRTKVLVGSDDRFLPADFQRRVVRERLGVAHDEMDGGHLLALSQPEELADWLERYLGEE
jgi:pimeloyl-ACP methyl ester carboxylesterase